jgi:hypothetical protein
MVIPSSPPLLAFTRRMLPSDSLAHTSSISRLVLAGLSGSFVATDDSVAALSASQASPVSAGEQSSCVWMFCCLSSQNHGLPAPLFRSGLQSSFPAQPIRCSAFRPWVSSLADVMTYYAFADFCAAVRPSLDGLVTG